MSASSETTARQGEDIAEHERQRLGLRNASVPALPDLCAGQGVPVFAVKLPDNLSGLFIAHPSVGHAIVVNGTRDAIRQRLAIAHGYAHAVCEPMGTIRVCTSASAKELIERRADAFVSAFLLPGSGVAETMRRLGKGQPSRQAYWAFDAVTEHSCASGRTLGAGVRDDDLPRWRVDRPSIRDDLQPRDRTVARAGVDCRIRPAAPPATHRCRARPGVPGPSGRPIRPRVVAIALELGRRFVGLAGRAVLHGHRSVPAWTHDEGRPCRRGCVAVVAAARAL